MLKNLRRKNQEKDRVHLECFKYARVSEHGYLHRPSAFAYCTTTHLLAIGTHEGRIKVPLFPFFFSGMTSMLTSENLLQETLYAIYFILI